MTAHCRAQPAWAAALPSRGLGQAASAEGSSPVVPWLSLVLGQRGQGRLREPRGMVGRMGGVLGSSRLTSN